MQVLEDTAPSTVEYLPLPHLSHSALPLEEEYVPVMHSVQVELPLEEEYVPAVHGVQVEPAGSSSALSLYLPVAHNAQEPPFGPVEPALQIQSLKAVLPTSECEFSGQFVHNDLSVVALYLPEIHSVHV